MLIKKIETVCREIEEVSVLLYQARERACKERVSGLVSQLIELNDMVRSAVNAGEKVAFREQEFYTVLVGALEALEREDYVLFADIMRYEVKEQIQEWVN